MTASLCMVLQWMFQEKKDWNLSSFAFLTNSAICCNECSKKRRIEIQLLHPARYSSTFSCNECSKKRRIEIECIPIRERQRQVLRCNECSKKRRIEINTLLPLCSSLPPPLQWMFQEKKDWNSGSALFISSMNIGLQWMFQEKKDWNPCAAWRGQSYIPRCNECSKKRRIEMPKAPILWLPLLCQVAMNVPRKEGLKSLEDCFQLV